MKKVFCVGAGGHARALAKIIGEFSLYRVVGFVEKREASGVLGSQKIFSEKSIFNKKWNYNHFVFGIGTVGKVNLREKIYNEYLEQGFKPKSVICPQSYLSQNCDVGLGLQIFPMACVMSGVELGENVLLNTGAIIEHDSKIGNHSHIAPGAVVCGGVKIGQRVHIGAGAVIKQGVIIGDDAVVGAGAVVLQDVLPQKVVVGNPAKILHRKRS